MKASMKAVLGQRFQLLRFRVYWSRYYSRIVNQGVSPVAECVSEISKLVCIYFSNRIQFYTQEGVLKAVMNRFESISNLPCCIAAIDGSYF